MNHLKVIIPVIFVIAISGVLILISNVGWLYYNNHSISYLKSDFAINEVIQPVQKNYLNTSYQTGVIKLNVQNSPWQASINLQSIELPPSNALNEINPIPKKLDNQTATYNLNNDLVLHCTKYYSAQITKCLIVSTKPQNTYEYGSIITNSEYYFEYRFSFLGMEWNTIQLQTNTLDFPDREVVSKLERLLDYLNSAQLSP